MTTLKERITQALAVDEQIKEMTKQQIFKAIRCVNLHPAEGVKDLLLIIDSHHNSRIIIDELIGIISHQYEALLNCKNEVVRVHPQNRCWYGKTDAPGEEKLCLEIIKEPIALSAPYTSLIDTQ